LPSATRSWSRGCASSALAVPSQTWCSTHSVLTNHCRPHDVSLHSIKFAQRPPEAGLYGDLPVARCGEVRPVVAVGDDLCAGSIACGRRRSTTRSLLAEQRPHRLKTSRTSSGNGASKPPPGYEAALFRTVTKSRVLSLGDRACLAEGHRGEGQRRDQQPERPRGRYYMDSFEI
jgi:hypothetical protein